MLGGRPLKTWRQVIMTNVSIREVEETIALDKNVWHEKIHFDDPKLSYMFCSI